MGNKKGTRFQKPLNSKFFRLILACLLIVFGTGLIFWVSVNQGYFWQSRAASAAVEIPARVEPKAEVLAKPVKINIPKLNRTLDISDGFFADGRWVISSTGVSYLITSGEIGKVGNAVLYGHNLNGVLGGLWRVQNGDYVEVTADNGSVYKYQILERREVKPNQVEILNGSDDVRLTIFTCSGFLDSARFVVVGKLVS